jgi:hypothetical protein
MAPLPALAVGRDQRAARGHRRARAQRCRAGLAIRAFERARSRGGLEAAFEQNGDEGAELVENHHRDQLNEGGDRVGCPITATGIWKKIPVASSVSKRNR